MLRGLALCQLGLAAGTCFFEFTLTPFFFFAGEARAALRFCGVFGLAALGALAQTLGKGGAAVLRRGGSRRGCLRGHGRRALCGRGEGAGGRKDFGLVEDAWDSGVAARDRDRRGRWRDRRRLVQDGNSGMSTRGGAHLGGEP